MGDVVALYELACCKRRASEGHAVDCELRYGTTHAMPEGEPGLRTFPCCGGREDQVHRGDMASSNPDDVTCIGKNEPLTVDQIGWLHEYVGIPWSPLGEDGEQAVMLGHVDQTVLAGAFATEYGSSYAEDMLGEAAWAVFREHLDDCRENLEPDEGCSCDEFSWWCEIVSEGTPGAIAVMWWSA